MADKMILRVQSGEQGTKRIETGPVESISGFLEKVQKEFGLSNAGWSLFLNRDKTNPLNKSQSKPVSSLRLKHGDMLFLHQTQATQSAPKITADRPSLAATNEKPVLTRVIEDEVDQVLEKQDGRIMRGRNEQLCRHGPAGKCFHCVPLEPYDETYLQSVDPPIKFLSFHSYIRKLTSGVDKGKFVNLENLSCKIKPGCREHLPWPGGICTKCQPNAVTLNRQKYRHIDYVQFENPILMDRFLNYWRTSGGQRIGLMLGKYEQYDKVPLGIKAVVATIYEPAQVCTRNCVELETDPHEKEVLAVAERLGLRPVGWIFTDLVAQDLQQGTVKHFRGNINSHFLSAEECIMAADLQCKYPNPCKMSSEGHFGSKFATVVVTGDDQHQIHFEGYQVSDQCMALVRDECLIPTVDAPELAYVKESTNEQYVPDVFFKEKDVYGNEVTQIARPLPVEYLLVDFPAAFPVQPQATFSILTETPFPIENRSQLGKIQDFNAFCTYMQQFPPGRLLDALSDFHLLLFLANCDMLPLKDSMDLLLRAVRDRDEGLLQQFRRTEQWATVEELMHAHMQSPPASRQQSYQSDGLDGGAVASGLFGRHANPLPPIGGGGGGGAGAAPAWTCRHCTFINKTGAATCEMCGLPNQ